MKIITTTQSGSTGNRLTSNKKFIEFWAQSCLAKKRYNTEKKANKVAVKLIKELKKFHRSYWCNNCAGFHLTTQKKGVYLGIV